MPLKSVELQLQSKYSYFHPPFLPLDDCIFHSPERVLTLFTPQKHRILCSLGSHSELWYKSPGGDFLLLLQEEAKSQKVKQELLVLEKPFNGATCSQDMVTHMMPVQFKEHLLHARHIQQLLRRQRWSNQWGWEVIMHRLIRGVATNTKTILAIKL